MLPSIPVRYRINLYITDMNNYLLMKILDPRTDQILGDSKERTQTWPHVLSLT